MKSSRRRLTVPELEAAHRFHEAGLILMPRCAVCGDRSTEVHHVIDAQKLRSENKTRLRRPDLGLPVIDVYDLRNGLGLCELCHVRHTRALVRVPRRKLRPLNLQFAHEHRLGWFIERFYPEDPEPEPEVLALAA